MTLPLTKRRKIQHEATSDLSLRSNSPLAMNRRPSYFSCETPFILSSYTTLIFYSILTITVFFLLFLGLKAIQLEIRNRIAQHLFDLENSIAHCRQQYQQNHCYDLITSPILAKYCEDWLKCMQKNSHVISRSDIAARVFGELINSFFDALTLKTMFALCLLVFGSVLVSFSF
ncbi:unnamed protein product [Absidia cylindrospora]